MRFLLLFVLLASSVASYMIPCGTVNTSHELRRTHHESSARSTERPLVQYLEFMQAAAVK